MSDRPKLSEKRRAQIARFEQAAQAFSEALEARDGTDEAEIKISQAKAEVYCILEEKLEG